MSNQYDLLIVGGGLVGASLACALKGQGLKIGLIEAVPFTVSSEPGYDDRTFALAYGTRKIFEGLGIWSQIADAATPILHIHISERGSPGLARLDHQEEGVEALGYVIEARRIGTALADRLNALDDVDLLCPARLERVYSDAESAQAAVFWQERTVRLTTRLLVAADGAYSQVRQELGIDAVRWDYGQTAIIANVTPERNHGNVAYERFTEAGPVAMLPMSEHRCASICTVDNQDKESVLDLADEAFLDYLQDRFGERLGRFQRVGCRQAFPLLLVKSRDHNRQRVTIIGNAAHTLHPIAGQGFNVGIRDVATLAEVIVDAQRAGEDPGSTAVLRRYADWRRWDQRRAVAFTDGLARLFVNPWLRPLRPWGLLAFDLFPPAKHLLARQTMGLEGRLPRLARGLPLSVPEVS